MSAIATRSAGEHHYTIQRAMQVLELLCFEPASGPQVSRRLGIHARTARRVLRALESQGYLVSERTYGRHRGYRYTPDLRLLALAAQLAAHHPLTCAAERATSAITAATGAATYAVTVAYDQGLVTASVGADAPPRWTLVPVLDAAAGQAMLAHRAEWRDTFDAGDEFETRMAHVRRRGYARTEAGELTTVAVPVVYNRKVRLGLAAVIPAATVEADLAPVVKQLRGVASDFDVLLSEAAARLEPAHAERQTGSTQIVPVG